jgi:lipoate-protein ligase A
MQHLDLTLPSAPENLALDEALLEACEAGIINGVLRFWEPSEYFVVVGYANRIEREVDQPYCQKQGIPVLRRCSGGGTVLQGPGCLNYAVVLRLDQTPALQSIAGTNEFVLRRNASALGALLGPVEQVGQTDLALGGLKFSGNSQRRGKSALLFHGSLLVNLDLLMVEKCLLMPSRQPEYRRNRSHREFLLNLKLPVRTIKEALLKAWQGTARLEEDPGERIPRTDLSRIEPLNPVGTRSTAPPFPEESRDAVEHLLTDPGPRFVERVASLVREKYGNAAWNQKF